MKSVNQVGESYLAVTDGEFVVIYGEETGQNLNQLQIIPIPGIKLIVHSSTVDMQLCCTNDAIYGLTKLPFYSVAFHLLSQGDIDQALEVVKSAEDNPPPGIDELDLARVLKLIKRLHRLCNKNRRLDFIILNYQ